MLYLGREQAGKLTGTMQPLGRLTSHTLLWFWAHLAGGIVGIALQAYGVHRYGSPGYDGTQTGNYEYGLILFGLTMFVVSIGASVLFYIWFYQALKNLHDLRLHGLSHSPGWAPGSFFVPVFNLFRPHQIMKETWNGSRQIAETGDADSNLWISYGTPALIHFWWIAFLLMCAAPFATSMGNLIPETPEELVRSSWAGIIETTIDLMALFAAMAIVRRVGAFQDRIGTRLGADGQDQSVESDPEYVFS